MFSFSGQDYVTPLPEAKCRDPSDIMRPMTEPEITNTEQDEFWNGDRGRAWVARADVRMAAITEPPEGTGADEKWFDVDLDNQVLVAYEGTRPVYATLVSTGKYGHWTPTLIARVQAKHESTPMTSDKGDVYSVADVPWTMFYDGHYALHTSYWHNGFGGPRSHGCINLAPRDARLLYQWSSPDVPPGWTSVYGTEQHPGSLVRIHAAKLPPPRFRGYAKRMREAAKTVASSLP